MRPCFPNIKSHRFRGKKWNIVWRAPRRDKHTPKGHTDFGRCDPNTNTLHIYRSSDPFELLDTVLDESSHANWFDLDNDSVREGVTDIIALLKRMGMRIEFRPNGR